MRRVLMITATAAALAVYAAPAADAAITWTVQPTPTPAQGVDGLLLAVSCVSSSDCTAVGGYTSNAGPVTLAEHWDGTSWAVQATPNPTGASFSTLEGVSCPSASDCTAVGEYDSNHGSSLPLAEHWDGSTWTVQDTPEPAATILNGVSCTSAASCTAVGFSGSVVAPVAAAERFAGGAWHREATASPAANEVLAGVSCVSASICTAAGYHAVSSTTVQSPLAEQSSGS